MISRPRFDKRIAAWMAAAGAAVLVLTASKCEEATTFPSFTKEICADQADNDGDGKIDCADSDCDSSCAVSITIDQLPGVVPADSLELKGHHTRATSIAVISLTPAGNYGTAVITGDTWMVRLSQLGQTTAYTVRVVASNGTRADTAEAHFTRGN